LVNASVTTCTPKVLWSTFQNDFKKINDGVYMVNDSGRGMSRDHII